MFISSNSIASYSITYNDLIFVDNWMNLIASLGNFLYFYQTFAKFTFWHSFAWRQNEFSQWIYLLYRKLLLLFLTFLLHFFKVSIFALAIIIFIDTARDFLLFFSLSKFSRLLCKKNFLYIKTWICNEILPFFNDTVYTWNVFLKIIIKFFTISCSRKIFSRQWKKKSV